MSSSFSFNYTITPTNKIPGIRAVFFLPGLEVRVDDLLICLDSYYENNPIPDEIWLLGLSYNLQSLLTASTDSQFSSRLREPVRTTIDDRVSIVIFNSTGKVTKNTIGSSPQRLKKPEVQKLLREGAFNIFQSRKGMLPKSDFHHYVKPSTKGVNQFIRAGNTLVDGCEIEFLALGLIGFLSRKPKTIYTDSHTVSSLIYSSVLLWNRFDSLCQINPTVRSFESYSGFASESFSDIERGFVLVSASTGGAMPSDLVIHKEVSSDRILTLYYLGAKRPHGTVLCDLTRNANQDGYEDVKMSKPGDSAFFPKKSLPIYIEPEGFFPNSSETVAVSLRHATLPEWLPVFANSFYGRKAIVCHGIDERESTKGGRAKRLALRIDPSGILNLKKNPFAERLTHFVRERPTLKRIVFFPDRGSKKLAAKILSEILKITGKSSKDISMIQSSIFIGSDEPKFSVSRDEPNFTLIVASTLVNGDSLVEVSQKLRRVQENYGIGYLIGVSCCESVKTLNSVKSNLQYSESGRDYQFETLVDVCMPATAQNRRTSWQEEFQCYERLIDHKSLTAGERILLSERMTKLDSEAGLVDDVFLKAYYHERLTLRRNSVLRKGVDDAVVFSQADVFASIYGWFHSLRCMEELSQNPLRRRVIDPNNFFRFNDGVIQSAILRSSEFGELSYSLDPVLSDRMTRVLDSIFQGDLKAERSEAFPEVLLAFLSGRLTLCRPDLEHLVEMWEKVVSQIPHPSFEKILLTAIRKKILT